MAARSIPSVANLDNKTPFGSADKAIKCIYYAFGYAEGLTPDQVYQANRDLLNDTCHWDDTAMFWYLAKQYGFTPHLRVLKVGELAATFTDSTKELVVIYELSGAKIPSSLLDKDLTDKQIETLLTDKAYDDVGLHAMYGGFTKNKLGFKDQNGLHNPTNKFARCVVFTRTKG